MFTDHSGKVMSRMDAAVIQAISAMGDTAVAAVQGAMMSYDPPVLATGALMADVGWAADARTLRIGNSLSYAPYVHDGTLRTPARPYLADGMAAALSDMEAVCRDVLAAAMSGD